MKKVLSLVLISIVFLSLTACKPKEMTTDTYKLIKQALSLMEDYHAGKITSEEVDGPLESISARLDAIALRDKGKIRGSQYALQNDWYADTASMYIDHFIMYKNTSIFNHDTYKPMESLKGLLD